MIFEGLINKKQYTMDLIKYNKLMVDNTIVYIEKNGLCHFRDVNNEIAIQFLFMHLPDYTTNIAKRINLNVFPLQNLLEGIQADLINDKVTIMANAEEFESAMIYIISVDTTRRLVEVKMTEQPNSELWKKVITPEEIEGVRRPY